MDQSILEVVKGMYPEYSEEKAKVLAMKILPWLTLLGSTAVQKIESAKVKDLEDVEARAQIVAFSVVSSMLFQKYASNEQEQLDTVVAKLLEINGEEVTPV